MTEIQRTITVGSSSGLHARPASLFVQAVTASGQKVTVTKGAKGPINAASILGILGLGVEKGDELVLDVSGDNAEAVADQLEALLNSDLDA